MSPRQLKSIHAMNAADPSGKCATRSRKRRNPLRSANMIRVRRRGRKSFLDGWVV